MNRALLALAITAGTLTSTPIPVAAQSTKKPISQEEAQRLTSTLAINSCFLLKDKVSFATANKAASSTLGSVIFQEHGSMIAGVNNSKPLTEVQLSNAVGFELAAQTAARCESLVPEKDLKIIKEIIGKAVEQQNTKK